MTQIRMMKDMKFEFGNRQIVKMIHDTFKELFNCNPNNTDNNLIII